MKLSHASVYALKAVVAMAARKGNGTATAYDLAAAEGISERFLPKLLKPLVRAGVLNSLKGPGGGYSLARPAAKITLLEVVEAVDGPIRGEAPGAPGRQAGDLDARLLEVCRQAADQARKQLGKVSVADLAAKTHGKR
jgi:Rrf2 family protein